jgi:protein involved in polysaccharide export with SLBB domain
MRFDIPEARRCRIVRTLVVALSFVAAPGVRAQTELPTRPDSGRSAGVLRTGDLLKVNVYNFKELSGEFAVDSRGIVQLPGVAELAVAGKSPVVVQGMLTDALKVRGYANPELSVTALYQVSVLGAVREPGMFPVTPGTNLIQLLTLAGGPTDRAKLRETRVNREGKSYVVDLESALSGGAAGDVWLYSNDVIFIPTRGGLTRENIGFGLNILSFLLAAANVVATVRR